MSNYQSEKNGTFFGRVSTYTHPSPSPSTLYPGQFLVVYVEGRDSPTELLVDGTFFIFFFFIIFLLRRRYLKHNLQNQAQQRQPNKPKMKQIETNEPSHNRKRTQMTIHHTKQPKTLRKPRGWSFWNIQEWSKPKFACYYDRRLSEEEACTDGERNIELHLVPNCKSWKYSSWASGGKIGNGNHCTTHLRLTIN